MDAYNQDTSMKAEHYLKMGLVDSFRSKREKYFGGFHLEKWLKRAFRRFNVDYHDTCCDVIEFQGNTVMTGDELMKGLFMHNDNNAATLTLPSIDAISGQGVVIGQQIKFVVDNKSQSTGGAITVTLPTGIAVGTNVVTGSTTMTVASGVVGFFTLYLSVRNGLMTGIVYRTS